MVTLILKSENNRAFELTFIYFTKPQSCLQNLAKQGSGPKLSPTVMVEETKTKQKT